MEKFLIVGSGGRESAFALNLVNDTILFAVLDHRNPTIIDCVEKSKGKYLIANASNPETVSEFAEKNKIDYAFINADVPLANGVVDALLEKNIKAIGGTKEATKIEWDKIYSINLVQEVCPKYTPFFKAISKGENIEKSIYRFKEKGLQVVVKPQGLTGGKGVKVMPEHLKSYNDAINYANELLNINPNEKILLVEKLQGIEFTIMGLTDGENVVLSPASYDYPFRLEDDKGAGTGGMGCFTDKNQKLPFMNDKDLKDCKYIMQSVINKMKSKKLFFNGVINGGFFKTKDGIKFMEFNGRFGDPEGLNILTLLKSPFSKLLKDIWHKNLTEKSVEFIPKASVIKYLVAKEYPMPSKYAVDFEVDEKNIKKMDINIFYASCIKKDKNLYKTLKKSRVIALGTLAKSIPEASIAINKAIDKYIKGNLEYRRDIGSKKSLKKLENICEKIEKNTES